MPESVYREAVTKLRILLEATGAASNAAAEAETETEKFNLRISVTNKDFRNSNGF